MFTVAWGSQSVDGLSDEVCDRFVGLLARRGIDCYWFASDLATYWECRWNSRFEVWFEEFEFVDNANQRYELAAEHATQDCEAEQAYYAERGW